MKTHNKESGVEKQVQEIIDSGEDVAVGILSLENWKEEIKQALQKAFTAGLMQEAEHTENYIRDAREDERERCTEMTAEYIYDRMLCNGVKPPWTPRGNSLKQEEARKEAKEVMTIPPKDNCFVCGKEVPKPEGSPKDRKRWVDKCEGCKK